MFSRTQSDEVVDSCKYAAGSCVWRTQSDEVIDGCKGIGQQAADVGILGTFTFASIIPSCSFTFASIIPSCSFPFLRVIPTLFSFFIKAFLLYFLSSVDMYE